MRWHGSWLAVLAVGATLAITLPCSAHQQIGLKLEQLNAEIVEHPNDAELYIQRSDLYRLNREWALAEADLDCDQYERNKQCIREECPIYPADAAHSSSFSL